MDHLATHHARLARDNEPRALRSDAARGGVAHHVHFCVMAAHLHAGTRLDLLGVTKAALTSTQSTPSSRAAVVAIHQDHVPLRVEEQRAELSARTVRGFGEREALRDANSDVFVVHFSEAITRGRSPRQERWSDSGWRGVGWRRAIQRGGGGRHTGGRLWPPALGSRPDWGMLRPCQTLISTCSQSGLVRVA